MTYFLLLFRCKSQSFQLIHDHYQRNSTWSTPSEATESSTDSLSLRQLTVMLQRQLDEEDHCARSFLLLRSNNACLTAECVWTRFQNNRSRVSILADTRFVGNAFVGFIVSQIDSRRFPVLCPTCTAEPGNIRPESIENYVSFFPSERVQTSRLTQWCIFL